MNRRFLLLTLLVLVACASPTPAAEPTADPAATTGATPELIYFHATW